MIPPMVLARARAMANVLGLTLRHYNEELFDYLAVPDVAWASEKTGLKGERWTLALDTSGCWTVGDTMQWDNFVVVTSRRLAEAMKAIQRAKLETTAHEDCALTRKIGGGLSPNGTPA
jgi:hypothetical protein